MRVSFFQKVMLAAVAGFLTTSDLAQAVRLSSHETEAEKNANLDKAIAAAGADPKKPEDDLP